MFFFELVAAESGIEHDDYLEQLSRGGTPSIALRNFIFKTFSIIGFISPATKNITKNVYVQSVSERVLINPGYSTNFSTNIVPILRVIFTKNAVKNLPPGLY